MYRKLTQKSLDIDWFIELDGVRVHIASNGGHIPWRSYKIRSIKRIYENVMAMSEEHAVGINEAYINNLDGYEYLDNDDFKQRIKREDGSIPDKISLYSESFVSMAKRGFLSFDRTDFSSPFGDDLYRLIAWPSDLNNDWIDFFKGNNFPLVRLIELLLRDQKRARQEDELLSLSGGGLYHFHLRLEEDAMKRVLKKL